MQTAELKSCLDKKERLTEEEEAGLDNYANTVNEHRVLGILSKSSDISTFIKQFAPELKIALEHLENSAQSDASAGNFKGMSVVVANCGQKWPTDPKTTAGQTKKLKATKAPQFEHKENATLRQCIEILDWHHANSRNQLCTAKHFDKIYPNLKIKQPLVCRWLKKEKKWREQWVEAEILPEFTPTPIPPSTILVASLLNQSGDSDPLREAEANVTKALDSLVSTGTLQQFNQMDLATPLHPAIEEVALDGEKAAKEIFKVVQDAPSSDSEGEEEGPAIELLPTCREVLEAAAVLAQFSMTQNDLTACRLEETLRSFTHQGRPINGLLEGTKKLMKIVLGKTIRAASLATFRKRKRGDETESASDIENDPSPSTSKHKQLSRSSSSAQSSFKQQSPGASQQLLDFLTTPQKQQQEFQEWVLTQLQENTDRCLRVLEDLTAAVVQSLSR
ncbi:hypothetical protein ACG7TL_007235 [Trametes sanguinea]